MVEDELLLSHFCPQLTGIAIGAAVALSLIGIVVYFVYKKVKESSKSGRLARTRRIWVTEVNGRWSSWEG